MQQTWIRGPQLRKRWVMSNSSFYAKLKAGLIPRPAYPFGNSTPYWSLAEIETFEEQAQAKGAK